MTDIQDLKAIAERCKGHQPLRFMQSYGALYIRNDNGIVFDVHQNRSFPDFMSQNKDYADLVLAANPAAVLELIKKLEGYQQGAKAEADGGDEARAELRQLKAINFDLHATLEAAKGEIERLHLDNLSKNGSLKALGKKLKDRERQIKALTRLSELNESLRKDAGRWQFIRDEWPRVKLNYNGEWFNSDFLEREIDAAMSKESAHD